MLSMWGFLLLYILAIGPLNYLLLRRLDRREWAYLTVPLLVLLFSGGAYVWGSLMRGQSSDLHQLAIARALPDTTEGRTMTYLTLFSPTRHSYDLRIMSEALVSDLQPSGNRQGAPLEVVDHGSEVQVPELLVDVGAVRPLVVEQTTAVPQLEATLQTCSAPRGGRTPPHPAPRRRPAGPAASAARRGPGRAGRPRPLPRCSPGGRPAARRAG